jgi:uncharacterized protein (DUF2267 family)/uncharacterized protein YbcI
MLAAIAGAVAASFKRAWGRGPRRATAHWAGADTVLVLLENGHTEAEKTLRRAGHTSDVLHGRHILQDILEQELTSAVASITGRSVAAMLSATRLEPDLSAEIFMLERMPSSTPDHGEDAYLHERAQAATARAHELGQQADAVVAQRRQVQRGGERARRGFSDAPRPAPAEPAPVTANPAPSVIDRSSATARVWYRDVAAELDTQDQHEAARALRAVLHALRDRLTVEENAQLAAQLPMLIRGVYYENWRPGAAARPAHDVETVLEAVASEGRMAGHTQASLAVEAVSAVLRAHVSAGELDHVAAILPVDLRALFLPER